MAEFELFSEDDSEQMPQTGLSQFKTGLNQLAAAQLNHDSSSFHFGF